MNDKIKGKQYNGMHRLGIDVGGTNIKFAVVKEDQIVYKNKIKTSQTQDGVIADILGIYNKIKRDYDICTVGIGVPGSVKNNLINTTNLPFKNYNLKEKLINYIPELTQIENDANCAAIAEMKCNSSEESKNLVLITLGTGIGGGIIINGKIYRGKSGSSGEIGHLIVEVMNGRECPCGQSGCLEQYASTSALVKDAENACRENKDSFLYNQYKKNNNHLSGQDIFLALENNCSEAKKVFDKYICYLAAGIDSVVKVFDPDAVFIAGGITMQGEKLLVPLKEKMHTNVCLKISKLQGDAGALGASML